MSEISIIYTTVSSQEEAEKLAEQAVKEKYAACVNILPGVLSVYEWEGKIEKSQECIVIFKTDKSRSEELYDYIRREHSYTVPAILKGNITTSADFYAYVQSNNSNGNNK